MGEEEIALFLGPHAFKRRDIKRREKKERCRKKGLFVHILVIPPSLYYFVFFLLSGSHLICTEYMSLKFCCNNQAHQDYGLLFFSFNCFHSAVLMCGTASDSTWWPLSVSVGVCMVMIETTIVLIKKLEREYPQCLDFYIHISIRLLNTPSLNK